jgi:hypothetical protein
MINNFSTTTPAFGHPSLSRRGVVGNWLTVNTEKSFFEYRRYYGHSELDEIGF